MPLVIKQNVERQEGCDALRRVVDCVYGSDAHYVRTSRKKLLNSLQFDRQQIQQCIFVAYRNDLPISCVVARLSKADAGHDSWGTLGCFESLDDGEAVMKLLGEAAKWLREQGATLVIGPMDGDTWHKYRFNMGPYDEPPFLMEPYNPDYYPTLWEQSGFEVLETYHSKRVEDVSPIAEKFEETYELLMQQGYKMQAFEPRFFDQGLERLYKLSLIIFSRNKLYTDISRESFQELYKPLKSVLDSRLAWFAQSPEGEDVGFMFAIQDYHASAAAMRGRSDPLAKLRFLLNKRLARAINLKSMGVVPDHRRSGIGIALVYKIYSQMMHLGFRRANLCLIHDDNPSSRLDGGYGTLLRRYCLYRYAGTP